MFETKIVVMVRDDLAVWQKLNVTAFLMSGIVGANPSIIGEPYLDKQNNTHLRLSVQPVVVLEAPANVLKNARNRAYSREVPTAIYIEEMFSTGHDEANRAVFKLHGPEEENVVGLALRADKKIADKITSGAKMHS